MNNRNKQLRSEVVRNRTETARQAVDAIARKFGGDQRDEIQTIVARIHKELLRIEDVANGCDMEVLSDDFYKMMLSRPNPFDTPRQKHLKELKAGMTKGDYNTLPAASFEWWDNPPSMWNPDYVSPKEERERVLSKLEGVLNAREYHILSTIEQQAPYSAKWVAFATSLGVGLLWLSVGVLLAYN